MFRSRLLTEGELRVLLNPVPQQLDAMCVNVYQLCLGISPPKLTFDPIFRRQRRLVDDIERLRHVEVDDEGLEQLDQQHFGLNLKYKNRP